MLRYDQNKRISAEQALDHKWIRNNARSNTVNSKTIKNLSTFQVIFYGKILIILNNINK